MKRIMIDLDDVIVENGFQNMITEFLGEKIDFGTNYYLQDLLGDRLKEFSDFFAEHNLYDYSELVQGAKETIKQLNENYKVYICSSYVYRDKPEVSARLLKDKFNFLSATFPFMERKQFVFCSDKSIIDCDIKIDDKINNLAGNCEKLIYTAYHNEKMTDEELKEKNIKRVNNWNEIKELLLK